MKLQAYLVAAVIIINGCQDVGNRVEREIQILLLWLVDLFAGIITSRFSKTNNLLRRLPDRLRCVARAYRHESVKVHGLARSPAIVSFRQRGPARGLDRHRLRQHDAGRAI